MHTARERLPGNKKAYETLSEPKTGPDRVFISKRNAFRLCSEGGGNPNFRTPFTRRTNTRQADRNGRDYPICM